MAGPHTQSFSFSKSAVEYKDLHFHKFLPDDEDGEGVSSHFRNQWLSRCEQGTIA